MSVATFTTVINQLLPEPHAGLLSGILFGTKASLSKNLIDALVITGTLHIIALSGQNISILTGFVSSVLLRFVSRRIASLLSILIIIGFVWFVGPSPSVIRAAIMGCIGLVAIVYGRQQWAILSLTLAVGIMLLINFSWISDISFQLSIGATLGIILFGGKKNGSVIQDDLRVTLAAQVFTVPLILFSFHRISLVSPLTNVLIGWTIPIIMQLGFVVAILGYLFLPIGQALAWGVWLFLEYIIIVIDFTSRIPFGSIAW